MIYLDIIKTNHNNIRFIYVYENNNNKLNKLDILLYDKATYIWVSSQLHSLDLLFEFKTQRLVQVSYK